MQRRAAAIWGAFFLVVALGSYATIGAASAPSVSVGDADVTVADGGSFTLDGRTYAASLNAQSERATLSWTVPEAAYSASWAEDDTVTFQGTNYSVAIPDADDPQVVELTEVRTLPGDVQTTEVDGTEYVVLDGEGDSRELVPVEAYLNETQGPAEVRTLREGRTYDVRGNRTTLAAVENDSATLEWTAPATESVSGSPGDVVTLGGEEYVVHLTAAGSLQLDRDVGAYERQLEAVDTYHERILGLWYVVVLAGLSAGSLLALAYLPSRY